MRDLTRGPLTGHITAMAVPIGAPAGGEFALLFVYMAVIYAVISGFGASAQTGFGVGGRTLAVVLLNWQFGRRLRFEEQAEAG